MALVSTEIKLNKSDIAKLVVVGPRRMEYNRVISLMNFIAKSINDIYKQKGSFMKKENKKEKDKEKEQREELPEEVEDEEKDVEKDLKQEEIENLKNEVNRLKNAYAKAYADTENVKKRLENEAILSKKYSIYIY